MCMIDNKQAYWKGKKRSEEAKRKTSETLREGYRTGRIKVSDEKRRKLSLGRMGEKNPAWKGDDVTYDSLHDWVRWHKPKVVLCENCGEKPPRDLANVSGEYKRDLDDYRWLCRKCHMESDNRLNKLILKNKSLDSRKNLSIKHSGKNNPMYGKTPWLGKHHTKETKKKISLSQKKRLSKSFCSKNSRYKHTRYLSE